MLKQLKVFLSSSSKSAMFDCSDLENTSNVYRLELRRWAAIYSTSLYEFKANEVSEHSITSSIVGTRFAIDGVQPISPHSNFNMLSEFIDHSPPAIIIIYNSPFLDLGTARFLSRITNQLRLNNSSWKVIYLGNLRKLSPSLSKLMPSSMVYSNNRDHSKSPAPNPRFGKTVSAILGLAGISLLLWFTVADGVRELTIKSTVNEKIQALENDDHGQSSRKPKIVQKNDEMQEWKDHISEFEMMMSRYSDSNDEIEAKTDSSKKLPSAVTTISRNRSLFQEKMSPQMLAAAQAGSTKDLAKAIDAGSDIDSVTAEKLESALIIAATDGQKSMVSWLIEHGADINQTDANERSALFYAAVNGHLEISRALLNSGANPNSETKFGKTPLMAAVHNNHVELSQLLVNANSDINIRDHSGWSAIFYASWNNNKAIGDLLLKNGAKPKLKDNEGYTARDIAMAKGSNQIVELL